MFVVKLFTKVRPRRQCLRLFQAGINHCKTQENSDDYNVDLQKNTSRLGQIASKYQVFREEDSEVILDIYDENDTYGDLLEEEEENPLAGLNLERGVDGVYDIEDLVDVLRKENAEDIFVASVPKEINYVNFICVVTGKSVKHMQAIAQFVRSIYKKKMHKTDVIPKLEGANSANWMALDLGNIALHIFSKQGRVTYDLDSLWSVGSRFDDECNKQDLVAEMLEKHSLFLHDLKPAS